MSGVSLAPNNFPLNTRTDYSSTSTNLQNLAGIDPRFPFELIVGGNSGPGHNESAPHSTQLDNQPAGEFMVPFVQGSFQKVLGATNPKNLGAFSRNRDDITRLNDGEGIGADWFERVHIFPQSLDLGNVVGNLLFTIDLYSSFRRDTISLIDIDNQISAQGVTVTGAPTLPKNHPPQRSIGVGLSVDQLGPPNIDGDIVFDYDIRDISFAVTGTRVILFPYPPQRNIKEVLQWKTDVIKSADGTETRSSLRRFPRQVLEYEIVPRRPVDLTTIRALLMEWQPRIFGVPIWWWSRKLTSDASSGATSVIVSDLNFMDLRVGGLVMIAQAEPNDVRVIQSTVLEVSRFGSPANTIVFTSALPQDFNIVDGAFITPVVPCVVDQNITLARAADGFSEYKMRFTSTANDSDLSDITPFSTYQSKVLLDNKNIMRGKSYKQTITHKNTRVDFAIGGIQAFSTQLVGIPSHPLQLQNDSNQEEWEKRGLFYALRGKQVSFFLPTFQPDLELISDASSGAANIDIANVGYTNFIQNRAPLQDIRILMNDGTVLNHRVTGSVEVSPGERLTITPTLSQDVNVADINEISFLVQVRQSVDEITIDHKWVDSDGDKVDSQITSSTIGVPDG